VLSIPIDESYFDSDTSPNINARYRETIAPGSQRCDRFSFVETNILDTMIDDD